MSTPTQPLARDIQGRSTIRVTKSGRYSVQFRTPEGWSSTTEMPTHAAAIECIADLRRNINSGALDQRGPAADRRVSE